MMGQTKQTRPASWGDKSDPDGFLPSRPVMTVPADTATRADVRIMKDVKGMWRKRGMRGDRREKGKLKSRGSNQMKLKLKLKLRSGRSWTSWTEKHNFDGHVRRDVRGERSITLV